MNCPRCDTHVDKHPAGRCMDAWVAAAVVGSPVQMKINRWGNETGLIIRFDDGTWQDIEEYSTDIGASFEVVEKINQDNNMMLQWYNPDGVESYWMLSLGFGAKITAKAPTAPLAICRVALKAAAK